MISRLTLSASWVGDDEVWRSILGEMKSSERKYADLVRAAVKDAVAGSAGGGGGTGGANTGGGASGGLGGNIGLGGAGASGLSEANGWVWLFSVREGKGFLLQAR
jgi:translation initiation factor 2-alpha kinase 4